MKNITSTFLGLLGMLALSVGLVSCEDDTSNNMTQLEREQQIIEDHLAENGITDYETTTSGIYYYTLREGTAQDLPEASIAHLGYEGSLPYGYIFDSSYLRDDTLNVQKGTGAVMNGYTQENCDTVSVEPEVELVCDNCPSLSGGVIPGWTESMNYLQVGSKKRFYIPSYLGYGVRGSGNTIPGNAVLIFDIEAFGYEEIPTGCPNN